MELLKNLSKIESIQGGTFQKNWIATAIGAGLGLASSLLGGSAASRAMKEAERRQRVQEAKESAWYNRRYNEDYADTAAGQNLIRRAKDFAKENWKKAAGAQAVAGGTDAATAQAKEAGNKMVGDTIANIAANDVARKDNADNLHRQAEAQFAQMDMNREVARAQNISDAAAKASNAIMQGASAFENVNLKGGSNNSTPTAQETTAKAGVDGGSNIGNLETDEEISRKLRNAAV